MKKQKYPVPDESDSDNSSGSILFDESDENDSGESSDESIDIVEKSTKIGNQLKIMADILNVENVEETCFGKYFAVAYDQSFYVGRLINLFYDDSDGPPNKAEMVFMRYTGVEQTDLL